MDSMSKRYLEEAKKKGLYGENHDRWDLPVATKQEMKMEGAKVKLNGSTVSWPSHLKPVASNGFGDYLVKDTKAGKFKEYHHDTRKLIDPMTKKASKAAQSMLEKIALNAQKAREMAKSVGLVPEPGTQWKWALRKMRKSNPEGKKTDELMQSGKELQETKEEVIGLLSNNQKQKLQSAARKNKTYETGIGTKGKIIEGDEHSISTSNFNQPLKAHTHPSVGRVQLKKTLKDIESSNILDSKDKQEAKHTFNRLINGDSNILKASPSGVNWSYTQRQADKTKASVQKSRKELQHIAGPVDDEIVKNMEDITKNDYRAAYNKEWIDEDKKGILSLFKGEKKKGGGVIESIDDITSSTKLDDKYKDFNFSRDVGQIEPQVKDLNTYIKKRDSKLNKIKDSNPKLYNTLTKNPSKKYKDHIAEPEREYTINFNEYRKIKRLAEAPKKADSKAVPDSADMSQIKKMPNIKHNILSKNFTGVHKARNHKLPHGTRSIYFKGGWGQ